MIKNQESKTTSNGDITVSSHTGGTTVINPPGASGIPISMQSAIPAWVVSAAAPSEGLRFNEGKTRLDLVPQSAIDGISDVLTFGARKYAEHNWRKGMKWSKVTASLKRHMAAIERGEDHDSESGLLHIDHVLTNAAFLKEYYKIYPQGDDRVHRYLAIPSVALDIDEVLADFTGGWADVYPDVQRRPTSWYYDRNMSNRFKAMKEAGTLDDFYSNLKPRINPREIPFEPVAYITARPVDTPITEAWLDKHDFPRAKVYTVGIGQSKVEVLKQSGATVLVDDSFNNFVEANRAGICCYLWDREHNRRFNVGHKRIYSLNDIV